MTRRRRRKTTRRRKRRTMMMTLKVDLHARAQMRARTHTHTITHTLTRQHLQGGLEEPGMRKALIDALESGPCMGNACFPFHYIVPVWCIILETLATIIITKVCVCVCVCERERERERERESE